MKTNLGVIVAAGAALAAFAAAVDIPNATDVGALRFGPMGVAALGPSSAFGGGGAIWIEYDGSWFGVDMRLGGHRIAGDDYATTSGRWENEYNVYPFKGKFRPYFTPVAGLGYTSSTETDPWSGERTEDQFLPIVAGYFGVRLNSLTSPFYMTFDGGFKYVDDDGVISIRNRYFIPATKALAARVGAEAAFDIGETSLRYCLVDVGPCFSF